MIVYSVQTLEVYEIMKEQGSITGNIEYAVVPEAYQWMMQQMTKRLPNYNGEAAPIWVWERRVKRREKCLLPKGTKGVILTLDIPEKDILWSPFEDWHTILNNGPFTFDEAEWREFEKRDFPDHEVRETWERLFDFEWLASRSKEWAGNFHKQWMQGVTPKISLDQIIRVVRFTAR